MKRDYRKEIEGLENTIKTLKSKVTNAISDDARAEIEGHISELEQAAEALRNLEATATEGEEDNTEAMRTNMQEILARVRAVEDSVKNSVKPSKTVKVNNTKEYEQKFYKMVHNSLTKEEFKANLKQLAVENSITITGGDISALLPAAVLNEVNDIFVGHRHRLLELVDWTGLPVFKAFFETGNDMANTWPSVMLGQSASENAKTQQDLTFTPIEIRPQFVYKTISIDKEVIKASESDGSVFVRYIVRELLDRLLCTVEHYILTGNSNNFVAPTATNVVLDGNNDPLYHALNYLPNNGGLIAVCTPSFYIQEKQRLMASYGYYISDEFMAKDYFGVDEIVMTPPALTVSSPAIGLWFMNPRMYKMVGDRRPDQYEDFNLEWNRQDYLMEMWVGGGCITPEFITLQSGN